MLQIGGLEGLATGKEYSLGEYHVLLSLIALYTTADFIATATTSSRFDLKMLSKLERETVCVTKQDLARFHVRPCCLRLASSA